MTELMSRAECLEERDYCLREAMEQEAQSHDPKRPPVSRSEAAVSAQVWVGLAERWIEIARDRG